MNLLKNKLQSNRGASMILALALFLICVMVSSVILAAASSGISRNAQRAEQQAGYLAVSSATDLILEEMDVVGVYVGKNILGRYCCQDCTVEGYIVYDGEMKEGVRLDAEYTSNPLDQDYASNPLDDGHLLMPKSHDPYVFAIEDGDRTTLTGVFGELFRRACNQVFETGAAYTETVTIGLSNEDDRLPDVICYFTMDTDYNVTFQLTTENSDYAVLVSSTAKKTIGDITESVETTDVHTIYYKKFDANTGSYFSVKEEWAIPVEVTSTATEISWGEPRIEKEVLSQ